MTKAFDSTIGLTTYNLLSTRGPMDISLLFEEVKRIQHPDLERPQFVRSLDQLVQRKRVSLKDDQAGVMDTQQARVVVTRSSHDLDKGSELGGWDGWVVRDPTETGEGKFRTLDSVLAEVEQ